MQQKAQHFVRLSVLRLLLVSGLMVLVFPGCVTTQKGGIEKSGSVEAAVQARVNLAKQYFQARQYDEARRNLKAAQEMDARSPDVNDALALTYHATGEIELAESHYEKAIAYGKGQSRYRFNYANFLFQQQKYVATEKQLKYIITDYLYERRGAALILLGYTQQQMLDVDASKESFERALVLSPGNGRVLKELSIINYDLGEYSAAWRYFQQLRRAVGRLSAEMLLFGVQLADELEENEAKQDYILALKNLYPESREYKSYLRDLEHLKSASDN